MTKEQRYDRFREDCEAAGFEVTDYEGREFYRGPAVKCERSELQDVIRATDVSVQWDSLGMGLIVYPR